MSPSIYSRNKETGFLEEKLAKERAYSCPDNNGGVPGRDEETDSWLREPFFFKRTGERPVGLWTMGSVLSLTVLMLPSALLMLPMLPLDLCEADPVVPDSSDFGSFCKREGGYRLGMSIDWMYERAANCFRHL